MTRVATKATKKKAAKVVKRANTKANTGANTGATTTRVKTPVKQAVTKRAKMKTERPQTRSAPAAVIDEIRISKDGARWTLLLSGGARVPVAAAAAQASGVRIGARWTAALATRVARAADEQRLITRAMGILGKGFTGDRAALRHALGGDAGAARAVRSLAETGWIR
jgi:hypothetical protein